MFRYLFVGAHPDDIEIGAGGTLARLTAQGADVLVVVAAEEDDPVVAGTRHTEAIAAFAELGVKSDRVRFLGLRDGFVRCDRDTVGKLRELLTRTGFTPSAVFTHLTSDSHNDHRAVADIVRSAVRSAVIFGFPVVNSHEPSHFSPSVFSDTSKVSEVKRRALRAHVSQMSEGRILWERIDQLEEQAGRPRGLQRAEVFQVVVQEGAVAHVDILAVINSCPFAQFWDPVFGGASVSIVHPLPVPGRETVGHHLGDRPGVELWRSACSRFLPGRVNVSESPWTEMNHQPLSDRHIWLSGGAVSNGVSRERFNRYSCVRYVIDYDMPGHRNIRAVDRKTGKAWTAEYVTRRAGGVDVVVDYGIWSLFRSPEGGGQYWMAGAMGVHSPGTVGVYMAASDPVVLSEMLREAGHPLLGGGFQVVVKHDVAREEVQLCWDTFLRTA